MIRNLYQDANAGFAILMITIPLLERYLRQKSSVFEGNLNEGFYREFLVIFPSIRNINQAEMFWQVYRNGLLHQVTLSLANRGGIRMPRGWLSGNSPAVHLEADTGEFWVDPKKFSEEVITRIDSDFSTFEGSGSRYHPLPQVVVNSSGSSGVSGAGGISGTSGGSIPFTPPVTGVPEGGESANRATSCLVVRRCH